MHILRNHLLSFIYIYVIQFANLDILYTYDILHNYNCFSDLCHVYRQYHSTMTLGFELKSSYMRVK